MTRAQQTALAAAQQTAAARGWGDVVRTYADALAVERGDVFDPAAADRVRRFLQELCCLSSGQWAGRPFVLQRWQWREIVRPLYGWRRADGTRRFRRASLWIPKKNGKTEIGAALALYHLVADQEPTPHVAIAAVDRYQSSIAFDAAARMVRASPALAHRLDVVDSRKRIVAPFCDGRLEALSADGPSKEGLSVSFMLRDELHAWRDDVMAAALRYSGAARRQPLDLVISTAGVAEEGAVGLDEFRYAEGVRDGTIDDVAYLPVIYQAPRGADWRAPATWRAANPSIGVTVREEELAEQCAAAQASPSLESAFRRYRLNEWVAQTDRAIDLAVWDANDLHAVPAPSFAGQTVYGGLDLAAVSDMTALVWVMRCPHDPEAIDVLARFWLPRAALGTSRHAALYRRWAEQGHLTITDGTVTDYGHVQAAVVRDAETMTVESIGLDRLFQGLSMAVSLADAGLVVAPVGMGFASMGPLVSAFERVLLAKRVHHGGHPVLRWHAENLQVQTDAAGNRKPSRESADRKIDGMVALLMAIDRQLRAGPPPPPPVEVDAWVI
jgi:phage terminase large subunit-like protein